MKRFVDAMNQPATGEVERLRQLGAELELPSNWATLSDPEPPSRAGAAAAGGGGARRSGSGAAGAGGAPGATGRARGASTVASPSSPSTPAGFEDLDIAPRVVAVPTLTTRQKIWRTFEEPGSSRLALLVATVIVATIIVSVTAFIVQTLPQYVWSTDPGWVAVEVTCIIIFTAEFLLRIGSTPSLWGFIKTPLNLVDLMAIAPFYVELAAPGVGGSSSAAIIRVVRLVRIFRIFKVARYLPWVRVFANALLLSLQPLLMLFFVVLIATVVFASVMYYAERGEWSQEEGAFMRVQNGEFSISPFQSIPASMWWAIITMTTVGYGDVYPVTGAGKFIASMAALCGILVIAIPITIISTNFNGEYGKLEREREKVKARMLMLRHHFKARRAGLEAVLDEVEDLVRRNTQEFASEVESLFEQSRSELTEEIQEIVRMAFERRRQLHLAALAAGRVQGSLTVGGGGAGGGGDGGRGTPVSATPDPRATR